MYKYIIAICAFVIFIASVVAVKTTCSMGEKKANVEIEQVKKKCPGDLNEDGNVSMDDLKIFVADFSRTDCNNPGVEPCEGDFNKDGKVLLDDLDILSADFGRSDCKTKK
jgi:hypothetical protein